MSDVIELAKQQADAVAKAAEWFADVQDRKNRIPANGAEGGSVLEAYELVHVISGCAGTGKTTAIDAFVAALKLTEVLYGAFTGKAALIMQRYNNIPARTVHSLIYKYIPPDRELCEKLYAQIRDTKDQQEAGELQVKLDQAQAPHFELNDKSDLWDAELLILDECSMINDEMLADLVMFQVPIIALGDPGQLPPIKGSGSLFTLRAQPDSLLTEIHRQAADNPIIEMSVRARTRMPLPLGEFGAFRHLNRAITGPEEVMSICCAADQVLTGKNATRQELNQAMRIALNHATIMSDPYPNPGEKLICLRNDQERGLLNGLGATVVSRGKVFEHVIMLEVHTEIMPEGKTVELPVLRAHFDAYHDKDALKNVKWWERKDSAEFDFGYALTVHKAQGSQWDSVVLYDDRFLSWDRAARSKWLYTAITRAAQTLTVLS